MASPTFTPRRIAGVVALVTLFHCYLILSLMPLVVEDQAILQEVAWLEDDIPKEPELPNGPFGIRRLGIGRITSTPPPMTIPPPPGFGNVGSGGGIDMSLVPPPAPQWHSVMVPGGLHSRAPTFREKFKVEGGGNLRSEAAVAAGLRWLARHQAIDGRWGPDDFPERGPCSCTGAGGLDHIAATALALLAFQGFGEAHQRTEYFKGCTYTSNIDRGLRYLIRQQSADGLTRADRPSVIGHALATLALCEAYAMTADPVLKGPAQRAVNVLSASRFATGHWQSEEGDLATAAWCVQALKTAQVSGLNVPNATFAGINTYLDSVGSPDGASYGPAALQPVGLHCRQLMGWSRRNPALVNGADAVAARAPGPDGKEPLDLVYHYYSTQFLYYLQGENWENWNPKMRDRLVDTQDRGDSEGFRCQKGSWGTAADTFTGQLGRPGSTALSILILETYYRHAPMYRRDLSAIKDEAIRDAVK